MRGFVMGWGIRILIIALIGGGAYLFRDRISGNAGELKVGDCYDDPATSGEIKDVQHHPCTEAHTAEVIHVGKLSGDDSSYPTDSTLATWVRANCIPAWNAYTGKDFDTDTVLDLGFLQPTTKGWNGGDRDVICYVTRVDHAPLTSSVKATQ
jgi:hypothetical protein